MVKKFFALTFRVSTLKRYHGTLLTFGRFLSFAPDIDDDGGELPHFQYQRVAAAGCNGGVVIFTPDVDPPPRLCAALSPRPSTAALREQRKNTTYNNIFLILFKSIQTGRSLINTM